MNHEEEKCPIEIAMTIIGTKWKIQILRDLVRNEENKMRFSDFKGTIAGISDKMLSQSLKELERDHMIHRELVDGNPPRTAYSLTEMGQRMNTVLSALYDWGTQYRDNYKTKGEEDA